MQKALYPLLGPHPEKIFVEFFKFGFVCRKQQVRTMNKPQTTNPEPQTGELERLRAAMAWIEARAREGKLEIAPSILGRGFEFGFWPKCDAKVVLAPTLLDAVEAAQR